MRGTVTLGAVAKPEPVHLWLGDVLNTGAGERTGSRLELEAADLTTHAAILGMTGSGKTGLGVILLEEADLEQKILDDVADIDEKWRAVAAEVGPLEVGLESADVKAVHAAVVWVRR